MGNYILNVGRKHAYPSSGQAGKVGDHDAPHDTEERRGDRHIVAITSRASLSGREDIVLALAKELHWETEKLDPTDLPEWDALDDHRKRFFVRCVEHLLLQEQLLRAWLD